MNKYLVCIGEGIGNMVETTPLIDLLSRQGEVSVLAKPTAPGTHEIVADPARVKNVFVYPKVPMSGWSAVVQTFSTNFLKGDQFVNEMENLVPFTEDLVICANLHGEAWANLKQAEKIGLKWDGTCGMPESFVKCEASAGAFDVVLHPGSYAISKAWPGFGELERRLKADGPSVFNAVSNWQSLPDFAATVRDARLFIGNDSGPAHISGATKTQTIIIYGPTTPQKNLPYNGKECVYVVETNGLPCRPCVYQKAQHDQCGFRCLSVIEVNQVHDLALQVLGKKAIKNA